MALVKISWDAWIEADEVISVCWTVYGNCPAVKLKGGDSFKAQDFRSEMPEPTHEEVGTLIAECIEDIKKNKTNFGGYSHSVYYNTANKA